MFHEELKSLSIADIQKAISKAIYELGGGVYHCDVGAINFSGLTNAELTITLHEHDKFFGSEPPPFPLPEAEGEKDGVIEFPS